MGGQCSACWTTAQEQKIIEANQETKARLWGQMEFNREAYASANAQWRTAYKANPRSIPTHRHFKNRETLAKEYAILQSRYNIVNAALSALDGVDTQLSTERQATKLTKVLSKRVGADGVRLAESNAKLRQAQSTVGTVMDHIRDAQLESADENAGQQTEDEAHGDALRHHTDEASLADKMRIAFEDDQKLDATDAVDADTVEFSVESATKQLLPALSKPSETEEREDDGKEDAPTVTTRRAHAPMSTTGPSPPPRLSKIIEATL